jgi:GNAT superfamily N-acetyltransferase
VPAHEDTLPVGFVHVVFDDDERWGSLVDNLHVTNSRRRSGIGTTLLTYAAGAVVERAGGPSMYLWVLERNVAAQGFYRALGGTCVGKAIVEPPGGVPERLVGSPVKLRYFWPDASAVRRRPDR